eukprot:749910-Hanusia_phi.AAC.1
MLRRLTLALDRSVCRTSVSSAATSVVVEAAISLSTASSSAKISKWWYYQPDRHDAPVKNAEEKPTNGQNGLANGDEGKSTNSTVVLDQEKLTQSVFKIIHEEKIVDTSYLMAVVTEYLRSLSARGIMAEVSGQRMLTFALVDISQFVGTKSFLLHPSETLRYHSSHTLNLRSQVCV